MMDDELSMANFEDLGDFLESVEATLSLLTSSSSFSHNHKIGTCSSNTTTASSTTTSSTAATTTMGFSSTTSTTIGFSSCIDIHPSVFEPTPIDPKRPLIVDTIRPGTNKNTSWTYYTVDDTTFDGTMIPGLWCTHMKTSASRSKLLPTAYQSVSQMAETPTKAPTRAKRVFDNSSFVPLSSFSRPDKRAGISRTRSCVEVDLTTLRCNHIGQWGKRFSELVEFQKKYGHCLVPINWQPNPSLAHWVKRQRYQYRIKNEGKHSSMTRERLEALQEIGFIWDSHSMAWMERWQELVEFKKRYGHPNVPKKFPERSQLAVWVKCQRRQHKLYVRGQKSNMTPDRIERLNSVGFVFNPRSVKVTSPV